MSLIKRATAAGWTCSNCTDMLLGKRAVKLRPRFFSSTLTVRAAPVGPNTSAGGAPRKIPNMRDQYRAKNSSGLYYTARFVTTR